MLDIEDRDIYINNLSDLQPIMSKTTKNKDYGAIDPGKWDDACGETLFNFALARIRDKDIAEDLVQETFLAGLKGGKSFNGKSSELTWLTSILKNKINDYYRKVKRNNDVFYAESNTVRNQKDFDENGNWNIENAPSDWGDNPEKLMIQKDFKEIFHRCLSDLSPKLASVFSLKEIEQKNSSEICKELNISPSNLWVMLHRSRLLLRRCLEVNWFAETK